jgi:hypothetical protein
MNDHSAAIGAAVQMHDKLTRVLAAIRDVEADLLKIPNDVDTEAVPYIQSALTRCAHEATGAAYAVAAIHGSLIQAMRE